MARAHYDGDYTYPTPVGAPVVEDLLLENAQIIRVTYHQLVANFQAERPTFSSRGPGGTAWAGLALVEISPATDLGGGICSFVLSWSTVPYPHSESQLFAFEYQRIVAGEIQSLSVPVRSRVTYTYFYTPNEATIPTAHFYRAARVGSVIIFVGTAPALGATQFLGEDETVERWKGYIWRKKSRMVPQLTYQTLA
jgi:hypothetical protein